MANQSAVPSTDPKNPSTDPQNRREVIGPQVGPTAERLGPTSQPNEPVHQQDEDVTTQNHSCPRCSVVQRTQVRPTTAHPVEQQDARPFDNTNTHANQGQNVNNRGEAAMVAPNRERAQTTRSQDNFDYNPPDVGSTQTLGASVAERRRRLVDRYLEDPEVYEHDPPGARSIW